MIVSKWKCEICGNEFENFHAQGFDNKIYCPLCYFKKENQELKKQLEEINKFKFSYRKDETKIPPIIRKQKDVEIIKNLENQQKEFIEYMNKTIEDCNNYSKYIEKKTKELHERSCGKTYIANEIMKNEVAKKILKEILSKYKKIIGGKDDNK